MVLSTKGSEKDTSLFEMLGSSPKTTSELSADLRKNTGQAYSVSEVFDFLVRAEAQGIVKRIKTEQYQDAKAASSISWILIRRPEITEMPSRVEETRETYIENAMIVVSQPIFLTQQGIDLRALGMPVLSVREAMEQVVIDAKEELRIACPYYDELFIDVLSVQAQSISKLKLVKVLSENMDPILIKARSLFPNTQVRTLYQRTSSTASELKVQGVHAKIIIADKSEVLIGSFNFRFSHIYYNVDLGLLAKGKIAEDYAKIYDSIWGPG